MKLRIAKKIVKQHIQLYWKTGKSGRELKGCRDLTYQRATDRIDPLWAADYIGRNAPDRIPSTW